MFVLATIVESIEPRECTGDPRSQLGSLPSSRRMALTAALILTHLKLTSQGANYHRRSILTTNDQQIVDLTEAIWKADSQDLPVINMTVKNHSPV
jgi:hypothetical protein